MTRAVLTLCACLLATAGLIGAPALAAPPQVPTAKSAIVVDAATGKVLFQKTPDEQRPMASTTKLMTALLTLEQAKPSEVFTAPPYRALTAESKINLRAGERMRVSDLLEGLLLESANDAAATLAVGISGSRPAFVAEMNLRAAELGLEGTSYANPIGLDDPENYSTARDLAKLSTRLMRKRRFARIVDMPAATLESGARQRVVTNRNDLVARFPFVDGIKTGHTLGAGYVLVGAGHKAGGARVITVVMGEPGELARDDDTLTLLKYGLSLYKPQRVLRRNRAVRSADIEHRGDDVALVPARNLTVSVARGERLSRRVRAPEEVEGPLRKGARVGTVAVLRDGRRVARVALVTARPLSLPALI